MDSTFQFKELYYILYDTLQFISVAALIVLVIGLLKNIKWLAWVGVALNVIVIGLILFLGPIKVSVSAVETPAEVQAQLDEFNLSGLPTSLPDTCVDQQDGAPVITSKSSNSGSIGTTLEIHGCNFAGFEGDKNAQIENSEGLKGILYGDEGSTNKLLKLTLKSPICQEDNSYSGLPCSRPLNLIPGSYIIRSTAWGKVSNAITFVIQN